MTQILNKLCPTCKQIKSYVEFYPNQITKDTYSHKCIICSQEYGKKYYLKNKNNIKNRIIIGINQTLPLFKFCPICKQEKSYSEFPPHKHTKDGYNSWCRVCAREESKKRYYRNPEKLKAQARSWNHNNSDIVKRNRKAYQKNNQTARIIRYLRKSLCKHTKFTSQVGLKPKPLRIYLETLFTDGINWENYGSVWKIYKIKKISEFDLTNPEEVKKINHYTNLQIVKI